MGIHYLEQPKQPWEELPRYVDFVDRIATGDTMAACSITAEDEAGVDVLATIIDGSAPTSISGTKVYYRLISGTTGRTYKVTFRGTSTAGAKVEEDLVVEMRQL
jgi:hypothetical protein